MSNSSLLDSIECLLDRIVIYASRGQGMACIVPADYAVYEAEHINRNAFLASMVCALHRLGIDFDAIYALDLDGIAHLVYDAKCCRVRRHPLSNRRAHVAVRREQRGQSVLSGKRVMR